MNWLDTWLEWWLLLRQSWIVPWWLLLKLTSIIEGLKRDKLDYFSGLCCFQNICLCLSWMFLKNSQTDKERTIFLTKNRSRSTKPMIMSVKSPKNPIQIQTYVLKATKREQNWLYLWNSSFNSILWEIYHRTLLPPFFLSFVYKFTNQCALVMILQIEA